MRGIVFVLVALTATVLSFWLGFGAGASFGPKQTTAAKALSPQERWLTCSQTQAEVEAQADDAMLALLFERYWRAEVPDCSTP